MLLKAFAFCFLVVLESDAFASFSCVGNDSSALVIGTSRFGCDIAITSPELAVFSNSELKTDQGIFKGPTCSENFRSLELIDYTSMIIAPDGLSEENKKTGSTTNSVLAAIKVSIDRSNSDKITATIKEFAFIGSDPTDPKNLISKTFTCMEITTQN